MDFLFLLTMIFCMYFQPVVVFPALAPYNPLKISGILSIIFFMLSKKERKPFFAVKEFKYFLFFCLVQTLSASSIWISGGIETGLEWLKKLIAVYLIYQLVDSLKKLKFVIVTILIGITYLSYYSITSFIREYEPGMRAGGFGWFDEANDLGIALVVGISLVILFSELSKGILSKTYLILLPVFSSNALLTGSRNVLLSLSIVVFGSLFYSRNISKIFKISIIFAMSIAILTFGVKMVLQRTDLKALTGDASSENRIVQWKAGIRMVYHHPFLGIGPGEFGPNARDYGGVRGLAPHNTIVQAFAETGIFGGLFYFLISYLPFKNAYLLFFRKAQNRIMSDQVIIAYKHLLICFSGFWFCAFFSNRLTGHSLYIIVALLVALRENILKYQNENVTVIKNHEIHM